MVLLVLSSCRWGCEEAKYDPGHPAALSDGRHFRRLKLVS